MEQLAWVQNSGFSTWIRESSWALFAALIAHTLGMGFAVGAGVALNARVLGLARRIPRRALDALRPVIAAGLVVAVLSGAILVIGYPAKALTNPLFYAKLAMASLAVTLTWRVSGELPPGWARQAAALAIPLWLATLTAGRFLAYTHKILLVY